MARSAGELAAATTADRDRYVDFLRATSIGVVVIGHWLMAVVRWDDGRVTGTNLLTTLPQLAWMTWFLQVMPLFFVVGGFANAVSWDAVRRRGGGYAEFQVSRVERLVRPVVVLVAVWVPVAMLLDLTSMSDPTLHKVTRIVVQMLWFLAIYLFVVAWAPALLKLHRRFGIGVLAALAGATAVCDVLSRTVGWHGVGYLNLLWVWVFAHQLGFFYADGSLLRGGKRTAFAIAATGLGGLLVLTKAGSYPTSMVGVPGKPSNMDPPTVCILALTLWLLGLALLARGPVTRWLQRRRPWTAVVALNGVIMTVFLWHLTAMLLAVVVGQAINFPQPQTATKEWWALRLPWFTLLFILFGALVSVFGPLEQPPARRARAGALARGKPGLAIVGMTVIVLSIGGFAVSRLDDLTGAVRDVPGIPVSPLVSAIELGLGAYALKLATESRDR